MCWNCKTKKAPLVRFVKFVNETGHKCIFIQSTCGNELCCQSLGDTMIARDGKLNIYSSRRR